MRNGRSDRRGISVLRFKQWFHFLVLPLAGWRPWGIGEVEKDLLRVVIATICAAGLLGFAYGINAISERRTDLDGFKNPLPRHGDLRWTDWGCVLGLLPIILGCALALGPFAVVLAGTSLIAGYTYSGWPRWKRWPFAGLLANLSIFAPLLGLLIKSFGAFPVDFWTIVLVFSVLLTQNQMLHERADLEEDQVAGDMTTARRIGARGTRWVILALGVLGIVTLGWLASGWKSFMGGVTACVLPTAVALAPGEPVDLRRRHRWTSCATGGLLYLSLLL